MTSDDGGFHLFGGLLEALSRIVRAGEDQVSDWLGGRRRQPSPYVIVRKDDMGRGWLEGLLGVFVFAFCLLLFMAGLLNGPAYWVMSVVGALGAIGGWRLISRGRSLRRLTELAEQLSLALGAKEAVPLRELAVRLELSVGELQRGIARLLEAGLIPEGRLAAPLGKPTLFLTEASYEATLALRDKRASGKGDEWDGSWAGDDDDDVVDVTEVEVEPEPAEAASAETVRGGEETPALDPQAQAAVEACDGYAARLRVCAGRVHDAEVSQTLASIAQKVESLASYVRRHPTVASQLRRLTGYYLPTTVELAESYAELEGQGEGPHAASTRDELRSTLRDVDEGITRLSDDLLQEQTFDLKADMEVLRQMMEQDGLSDDD